MVAVNASWGLGLAVVGGEVTPDDYLVCKVTREVVRQHISDKAIEYVPGRDGPRRVDVAGERRGQPCLTDLGPLLALARRIERHFGAPQDIEWAIDRDRTPVFVLQSRPVTGVAKRRRRRRRPAPPCR